MKINYIKWRDAGEGSGTNVSASEIDPERVLESVGLVVKEDEFYITLAMDVHLEDGIPVDMFNQPGSITKANIIERRQVDLKSARRWKRNG